MKLTEQLSSLNESGDLVAVMQKFVKKLLSLGFRSNDILYGESPVPWIKATRIGDEFLVVHIHWQLFSDKPKVEITFDGSLQPRDKDAQWLIKALQGLK